MKAGRRKKRGRFTLIELLVVIAVILLLISLLMPSLRKAKTIAYSSACKSNLRQIGMWGIEYANDWNGVLPTDGSYWGGCGIAGYTSLSSSYWYEKCPYFKRRYSGTVMHCPQAVNSIRPFLNSWYAGCSYGLNFFLGAVNWPNASWNRTPAIPSVNDLNSAKYWFGDAAVYLYSGNYYYYGGIKGFTTDSFSPWTWYYAIFETHPGRAANFVYGDGHTGSLIKSDFIAIRSSSSLWRAFSGGPNFPP